MLPNRIGRYEVLGQLATGGMAEILLATLSGPSDFRRAVVIKRILRQYAQKSSFVAMFLDEARIVAKIRHPNLVAVQELGEEEGEVFLVLEYVAGENLSSVLKRATAHGEKMDPELVAHVVAEACAGLHAAHELVSEDGRRQNLVHRDVSPQNIFVAYDGHVKILDFGVAITEERVARTEVGDVKGKFEYMSPEQAEGEPLDRRSDIFAMGIVLYELSTGRRLFKRTSVTRALEAITKEPVIPPSRLVDGFPPALEAAIMRALSKKPDDRYATAADMRKDLLEIARALPSPVESLAERMQRWFSDRIVEKNDLLRRVTNGDPLPALPAGEVDEPIRIPNVPDAPAPDLPLSSASPRSLRPLGIALTALTALAALAIVAIALAYRARTSSLIVPAGFDVPVASASASAFPSASASASASDILIHIESRPPGAHVLTDGTDQGTTPLDLRVARSAAPIVLELRSQGFAPTSQTIVPDTDPKLLLALQPLGKGSRPRPPATAPKPSGAPSGFRRFD